MQGKYSFNFFNEFPSALSNLVVFVCGCSCELELKSVGLYLVS